MNDTKQYELIDKLIKYDIIKHFDDLGINSEEEIELNNNDVMSLCNIASKFSLSNSKYNKSHAYDIATKLFINFEDEYEFIKPIAYNILSRLGNFPGRQLLGVSNNHIDKQTSFLLKLENFSREIENRISLNDNNEILTDFQKDFFDVLTNESFYSVSAPTSAGKSFVFTLSIVKRLLDNPKEVIILIVPTRALIQELSVKVLQKIKKYKIDSSVDVRTIALKEDCELDHGRVYILTQERVKTLLEHNNVKVNTCFVDEAQEIQNNRGVVLQNTIEALLKKFPKMNLFFASPLIKNPQCFSDILKLKKTKNNFIEEVSPVGQNLILLSEVFKKVKQVKVDLLNLNSIDKFLGKFKFNFKFRSPKKDLIANIAELITKDDDLTLIYCNGTDEAEKRAKKLSENLQDIDMYEGIQELIEFIKEDIHTEYSLISCLKKGVAFHYGKMPANIRVQVENLAADKKLKYIFCTSTLLQGVNLPAKNIIINNPKKGNKKAMNRADFLNLIGRAGRLCKEFHGNIWCLCPEDWVEKCYEGEKLQNVKSYYFDNLTNKTDKIKEIAKGLNCSDDLVSVFGKFYNDHIIDRNSISEFQSINNYDEIVELHNIATKIPKELPDELIKKHYFIHPLRLNEMFAKLKPNLMLFTPQNIYDSNAYECLKNIFELINTIFLKKENKSYIYHTLIANKWIHGDSIKKIITESHNYNVGSAQNKNIEKPSINKTIRETLGTIESDIRFKYVNFMQAYIDILNFIKKGKDPNYDEESVLPYALYLECGACASLVLNYMALGLSRLTSIKLGKINNFKIDDPSTQKCYNKLKNINLENISLPNICKQEIKRLILDY